MHRLRWAVPERHDTLPSTNLLALEDPRPGRVVVAEHQSAGLGRRGRRWESPPGTALAVTVVLPPVPAPVMGWLPLAAGVALVQALAGSPRPVDAGLKWPNDVLVPAGGGGDGRAGKLAGILAQVAGGGDVVLGTGVNVDHDAGQLPVPTATSWRLATGGRPVARADREALLTAYLERLADAHDGLVRHGAGSLRETYRDRCLTLGRAVVVHLPDGARAEGTAVDVDVSGALVVEGPGGRTVHHAGDVEHVRPQ